MLSDAYNIVISRGVGSLGHDKYVVYGFSDIDKRFLTMLMTTVQLTSESTNESYIVVYTSSSNKYVSLAK